MKFFHWISLLIKENSDYSCRSFGLFISSVAGFLIAVTICIILIIDVCYNGRIDSDMEGIGWVLTGTGLMITGGNIGKIFKSKYQKKETEVKDV